jgi:hypothetical protein
VLVVIAVIVALFGAIALVRFVRAELRPSEIDRFRDASRVTSAWSRGETPAVYPEEPVDQRSSSPRQGLSRSSRT